MMSTSTFEEAQPRYTRKQRRSSALAVTTETKHLLECIQFTVQVNEDIAQLHDLLTQLGSNKDTPEVRNDIHKVILHCLDVAKSAKDRFLYIVIHCRDNVKLQNQAGQHMGIFGFCLTYMQKELQKCLNLITGFPGKGEVLTPDSLHIEMAELDDVLHNVEKHVHYIRPSTETEMVELYRSKSDRAPSSRSVERISGTSIVTSPLASSTFPVCKGLLCMPSKYM
ncbi:hypothetical protein RvY_10428 [Ramazzottius varieornatus]|uniref:Uncharacterized protein n=1 Tax=Ramazzottius varieornatus TaxID=947166 RepID=A0A1D1VH72_RAMVA|nr:hypothetical protein RvY_10428 [Ramazzottius varieornatus]